jgi:NACHT domain
VWLKTGSGVYWINGKPGSGKSTLMKHIYDDERTRLYLKEWAQIGDSKHVPLVIASFFFWNSGTMEQRSQIGMLRALLFQVLDQELDLIPIVLPDIWARLYSKFLSQAPSIWSEPWTLRLLLVAFKRLLAQKQINVKICFLIDGLDEFDGNHEVLAELFHDVVDSCSSASNVKVCLSSRPWVVFKDNFGMCPSLQLQNLTFTDIKNYVDQEFRKNSAFRNLLRQDPRATDALVEEVVTKAEGVFLWVHIVVKDLLKGIRNRDSIPDLWKRVNAMPRELEPLYSHMMSQIEPGYLV